MLLAERERESEIAAQRSTVQCSAVNDDANAIAKFDRRCECECANANSMRAMKELKMIARVVDLFGSERIESIARQLRGIECM